MSLCLVKANAQNIGINATGSAPNSKSMVDIDVSGLTPKKGLLIPRMTTTERNTITAPIPESLLIYNTTTQCFEAWNQTAAVWVPFGCIGCTMPAVPIANSGTSAATNGFIANWVNIPGATSYVVDVSTSPTFASFVIGYNAFNVGNTVASSINSLTCAATYYYRVRAINPCGISPNSNTVTVTTSICPTPTTGTCGTQVWAAANLNVGTMITGVTNQTNNSIIEKYCYNDLPANCTTYGGLYQWDEMMNYTSSINCDPCGASGRQGICPTGYHVPTDLEWSRYEFCVESTIAPIEAVSLSTFQTTTGWRGINIGNKLKVTSGNTPVWDGTNTIGFSALPSGYRDTGGSFYSTGTLVFFWTATEFSGAGGWFRYFSSSFGASNRLDNLKACGFTVRCLQD